MLQFASLPPELVVEMLQYLPIKTLLDFGLTSKHHYDMQRSSLATLRLGVFHSKLSGVINLMEASAHNDVLHSVQLVLPWQGSKNKDCVIFMQNTKVQQVLREYRHSLKNLEIAVWDVHEETASLLGQLHNLRHLSIRLDHPHTRHPAVKQGYWQAAQGSTAWNFLACKAGRNALGRLQSLNLERSGITDWQLRKLLECNPKIVELRLHKCFNLTKETFKFLAVNKPGLKLVKLHFTMVSNERIDERILEYIGKMKDLKSLSLRGCHNIDCEAVKKMNKRLKLAHLSLPSTPKMSDQELEVDADYR